eukprot:940843_1
MKNAIKYYEDGEEKRWCYENEYQKLDQTNANYGDNANENTNTSLKRMDNKGEYGVSDDVCRAQNHQKPSPTQSDSQRNQEQIPLTATPTTAVFDEFFEFWSAADGVGCDTVIDQQCFDRIESKDPSPTQSEHQQYPPNQRQDTVAV